MTPDRDSEALNETYRDIDRIISDLVECYALPHTKMCMRWSKPTIEEYREEVARIVGGKSEAVESSYRHLFD